MVIISKISKGSKMDQIYLPKNRSNLNIGDYVIISPLNQEKKNTVNKTKFLQHKKP